MELLWHLKHGNCDEHTAEECLADRIYRACGLRAPASQLVREIGCTGDERRLLRASPHAKGVTLAQWLPFALPQEAKAVAAELAQGLIVDAWLGNCDVIGRGGENIIVSDLPGFRACRVDNGSALRWRAKTGRKTAAEWNNDPLPDLIYLQSAFDWAYGPQRTPVQLANEARRLNMDLLTSFLPTDLQSTLAARLAALQNLE